MRLALLGEKLGHKVYLVVEKLSELELILEEARELDVTPRIGLRARLAPRRHASALVSSRKRRL